MSVYELRSDDNQPISARLEIEDSDLVFHARGGRRGATNAHNSDYSDGLLILLKRMKAANLTIVGVWVDSSTVQSLPLEQRQILGAADRGLDPDQTRSLLSKRMIAVGQKPGAQGGNSTKRIRIKLERMPPREMLVKALNLEVAAKDARVLKRLPAEVLNKVTAENIWHAIENLVNGTAEHHFGESTDYDLLVDEGTRLPPKAVFGLAASEALGFEVLPEHFSAGPAQLCFRILRNSGYAIVPKSASKGIEPLSEEEKEWREGKKKAVVHLKRERAPGLSQAKKAQFLRQEGKLFCERCRMDPAEKYGQAAGDACIEVHHRRILVKDMKNEHRTRLEDLQCLCANCHRIVHRELKIEDAPISQSVNDVLT
jgi:hypothetical protein